MHYYKLNIIAVLLFIFTATTVSAAPTAQEYGTILNLAGKQRMLSQKMSKEVILVALKYNTEDNLRKLSTTARLFDKTLKALKDGNEELGLPPTDVKATRRQLAMTEILWRPFYAEIKNILQNKRATNEQVDFIANNNIALLKSMNKAVRFYERDSQLAGLRSDPELATSINLSGKQRMLSQKMSKEFLLIAYKHEVSKNKQQLTQTVALFDQTLRGLSKGDETLSLPGTEQDGIVTQLNKVDDLWSEFKPAIESPINSTNSVITQASIRTVADSNLSLLAEMNRAVEMFSSLARKSKNTMARHNSKAGPPNSIAI